MASPKPEPFLIEVSSEAGRKIGGIYTVLQSKSRPIAAAFKDRYLLIGFYDPSCAHEVKMTEPPAHLKAVFGELAAEGIYCHWGAWRYAHDLPIILVEARQFAQMPVSYDQDGQKGTDTRQNRVKYMLWKHFGVDSLMDGSWDFAENAVWGWAVGMVLERLCRLAPYKGRTLVGQFHEWITGSALLYARLHDLPLSTVFTTHATCLGRSLSNSGVDVLAAAQGSAQTIDGAEAYRLHVEAKHQLETAAARKAHVFTTVSETVALECRYILGRYPDVITLNGLDFEHEEREARLRGLTEYVRGELLQMLEAVVSPHYPMRYDNALLVFSSGRYEFANKGFDIYIAALGKLNARIKARGPNDGRHVIGLLCAPSSVRGPRMSVIRNYLLLDKVGEVLDASEGIRGGSDGADAGETYPNTAARVADARGSLKADLEAMMDGLIKDGERPPACLFDLTYPDDPVMRACEAAGLRNAQDDPVKMFFYPSYMRPNDGLLNMPYNDVIAGMDIGVFPSRYEPFGYTPLEAGLKLSIPVSTDSAGFGRYLLSQTNPESEGARILRMGAGAEAAAEQLADFLEEMYYAHHTVLERRKEEAYRLMHLFDWRRLAPRYLEAYALAIERRTGKRVEIRMDEDALDGAQGPDARGEGGGAGGSARPRGGRGSPRASSVVRAGFSPREIGMAPRKRT